MDIQKEREAFEKKFPVPAYWIDFCGLTCKYICKYNTIDDQTLKYQARWESWLAAKAQAVPEGFVLMPRICTNKMAHAAKAIDGRLSAFKYADVYKAMIEAQEPTKTKAVPECKWTQNEDGYFDASCGQSFVFSEPEDKPSKHKFTHCCFCGGKLVEAREPAND